MTDRPASAIGQTLVNTVQHEANIAANASQKTSRRAGNNIPVLLYAQNKFTSSFDVIKIKLYLIRFA